MSCFSSPAARTPSPWAASRAWTGSSPGRSQGPGPPSRCFSSRSPAIRSTGSQISWTTSSHEGLAGWAVFREEVQSDGRIARVGPQIVPSSTAASESFRYVYADAAVRPATFYRYTVWAVTEDGLLARAFAATFRTPE